MIFFREIQHTAELSSLILYDQGGASPGSCNSSNGLKQLFGDEIQLLVPGASDMKQNYATICASTHKYE